MTRSQRDAQAHEQNASNNPSRWWSSQSSRVAWVVPPQLDVDWRRSLDHWFSDGTLNGSFSCTDVHVIEGRCERPAFHWVGDREGDVATITYFALHVMINHATNALKQLGLGPNEYVVICMPTLVETVVAMLAVTRLGSSHVVLSPDSQPAQIAAHIARFRSRIVIAADGYFDADQEVDLKSRIDDAVQRVISVESVLFVRRTGHVVEWSDGRDFWWHDIVDSQSDSHWCDPFPSEQAFFVALRDQHDAQSYEVRTTGGYLVSVATKYALAVDADFSDGVYWTAAELHELAGHGNVVYGPLVCGASQLLFEAGAHRWDSERCQKKLTAFNAKVMVTDHEGIVSIR